MDVPLALAAPAALVAGGAWLIARGQLNYDYRLLKAALKGASRTTRQANADRLNLFWVLEERAFDESTAGRPFLVYDGQSWTYRETYAIVLKYGTWLKTRHSVKYGDVVSMVFMNSATFLFLVLGLWGIGARPAFINYNLTAEPLIHCIKVSGARLVLVDLEIRPNFTAEVLVALKSSKTDAGGTDIDVVFWDDEVNRQITNIEGVREPDSSLEGIKRSDMAILIYTSGTTGLPKAAIVSFEKLYIGAFFAPATVGVTKTERFYTCMPLYHSAAFILAFCPTLGMGSALIIGRRFGTSTFWADVRRYDATMIQYVGETCRYLLAAPPQLDPITGENLDRAHKVRMAFGNGLRPDVWNNFKERFGIETIGEMYAASEGPRALFNISSNDFSSGAVGRTGFLTSMIFRRISAIVAVDWVTETPARDPRNENFCTRVKQNEPGELIFRLNPADIKALFQGYHQNQAATEGKVLRDVFVKGDAFFRTGDVLRWDSDGRWWFCDRIGDTYRWKSENVSTVEVSEVFGMHPQVAETNVYGVEVPHHDGRIGCAAVVIADQAKNSSVIGDELMGELARYMRSRLPSYAVPGFVRIVNSIDLTGTNKHQKVALRRQGVDPANVGGDPLFWLRGDKYVPFGQKEWRELNAGGVRL